MQSEAAVGKMGSSRFEHDTNSVLVAQPSGVAYQYQQYWYQSASGTSDDRGLLIAV